MVREFAERMMDAGVEVACNAGYGEVTPDPVNSRNGYRRREWDTRVGTIELAILWVPKNGAIACDLGIFVDQAAEPIPAQDLHASHFSRRIRPSGGRVPL